MKSSSLDDFYMLSCDEPPRAQRVALATSVAGAQELWEASVNKIYWDGTAPIPIYVYEGVVPVPIFSSGLSALILGSPLVEIFESNRFSGSLLRRATVYDRMQREAIPVHAALLRAEVGAGNADRQRGIVGKIFNSKICKDDVGFFFDPTTWTGLDVFRCADNSNVIVHRRVASILMDANIDRLIIENVEKYRSHFVGKRAWWFDPTNNPLPRPSGRGGLGSPN